MSWAQWTEIVLGLALGFTVTLLLANLFITRYLWNNDE